MESRAKSPQPPRRATCGGERGAAAPRRRERESGRLRLAAPGRVGSALGRVGAIPAAQGQAEATAPRREGAADVPAPRWPSCCQQRRETRAGCGSRSLSPWRAEGRPPPPATPAGPGHPPGPPAAESAARPRRAEPGWAGSGRTEPSRIERSGAERSGGGAPSQPGTARGAALLRPGARTRPSPR